MGVRVVAAGRLDFVEVDRADFLGSQSRLIQREAEGPIAPVDHPPANPDLPAETEVATNATLTQFEHPIKSKSPIRIKQIARLLALALFLGALGTVQAATLLKNNFEVSNPWTSMAGYFTTAIGTVTATLTYTAAGTIDTCGTEGGYLRDEAILLN